jgi:hypothetical protein
MPVLSCFVASKLLGEMVRYTAACCAHNPAAVKVALPLAHLTALRLVFEWMRQ